LTLGKFDPVPHIALLAETAGRQLSVYGAECGV
jgi:hypothetical protein